MHSTFAFAQFEQGVEGSCLSHLTFRLWQITHANDADCFDGESVARPPFKGPFRLAIAASHSLESHLDRHEWIGIFTWAIWPLVALRRAKDMICTEYGSERSGAVGIWCLGYKALSPTSPQSRLFHIMCFDWLLYSPLLLLDSRLLFLKYHIFAQSTPYSECVFAILHLVPFLCLCSLDRLNITTGAILSEYFYHPFVFLTGSSCQGF